MSDREEFEKWLDEHTSNNYGVAYYVEIGGKYCFPDIELAWQAWQAAQLATEADEMMAEMAETLRYLASEPFNSGTAAVMLNRYNTYKERNNKQ